MYKVKEYLKRWSILCCCSMHQRWRRRIPTQLLGLTLEIILDHSCLVFCPTKKNCENVALMLSKLMAKYRRYDT